MLNYSSNLILKELIKKNPTHFKKEILGLYKTEKQLKFAELKLLVCNDVLLNDKNWNQNIEGKYFKANFE